jgi:hypothetical protein
MKRQLKRQYDGSFAPDASSDAKRVTVRMANVALTYFPWHVRRRKRRNDAELQRVLVKRIDFSRRF